MGSSCSAGDGHQGFNELETVEGAQITETFTAVWRQRLQRCWRT